MILTVTFYLSDAFFQVSINFMALTVFWYPFKHWNVFWKERKIVSITTASFFALICWCIFQIRFYYNSEWQFSNIYIWQIAFIILLPLFIYLLFYSNLIFGFITYKHLSFHFGYLPYWNLTISSFAVSILIATLNVTELFVASGYGWFVTF